MISIFPALIGLIVAVTILVLVDNNSLYVKHGIDWLAVTLMAILGFAPIVDHHIVAFCRISYPPALALALTLGVALVIIKILLIDIENRSTRSKITYFVSPCCKLKSINWHQPVMDRER